MSVGKIALVTGANRGIGLEIARQLAGAGLTVVLGARDGAKGAAAVKTLGLANVSTVTLDVTKPASVTAAVRNIIAGHGRIDVLVNNAGILLDRSATPPVASPFDLPPDLLMQTLETNVAAPLRMIQAVIPHMRRTGYGRIVNLSSRMGSLTEMAASAPAYRISKTALNAVTTVAAAELGKGDIKINSMHPGWVQTDMGGPTAPVKPEAAADTAVWLATLPEDGPTGGFFFERKPIPW